ncbi:MAG: CehA/McbA family metallohydrolase [Bacteroidota bacterium]|nr:CehA/McbA family metallohydrolase [Bacteroidota bacterium]
MMQLVRVLAIFVFIHFCSASKQNDTSLPGTENRPVQDSGIVFRGKVYDALTGSGLPARIVIKNDSGNVVESYFEHLPGFFTSEDGTFHRMLKPGRYELSVFHGIDYESVSMTITIDSSRETEQDIYLKRWSPLKKNGWICGDGHNHLDTKTKNDEGMLKRIRQVSLAQGIDFICGVQEWAGYNDQTWRAGYAKVSDSRFLLHYGAEMPKYRTGHTWWIGLKSTHGYFDNSTDKNYEEKYYQNDQSTFWDFDNLPLASIPDVDIVQRLKTTEHAVAIMAHPTSWWWQTNGNIQKYVTNAAACLPFGLLAGKVWDGMTVMGYKADHYFYQNLWFGVLNAGYRMPAVSELDGNFSKSDKAYFGSYRTYYQTGGKISIDKVAQALRNGKTFVSSGPIIQADVDNKYGLGDIVRPDGKTHDLHISAYASGDATDFLSYIVVYRNGKIFRVWDLRQKKPRKFKETLRLNQMRKAWFIIKAYGKAAWRDPAYLDIVSVCKNKNNYPEFEAGQDLNSVAFTSPIYFWPRGATDPGILQSEINVTVVPGKADSKLENLRIEVFQNGRLIRTIRPANNKATFTMPVNCRLKISCTGRPPIYRSLYLDYPPHARLVAELASGKWMEQYPSIKFGGGEIPWEAFHLKEARELLAKVNWTIEMIPNTRDSLWRHFEAAISPNIGH